MDVSPRKGSYQAECFTPKRCLARTPPKNGNLSVSPCATKISPSEGSRQRKAVCDSKRVLKEKNVSSEKQDKHKGSHDYQANCFTPKRCLARTPPKNRDTHKAENSSPGNQKATSSTPTENSKAERRQNTSKGKGRIKTQDASAASKLDLKSLKELETQDRRETRQDHIIDEIPPPKRWELPRTPVRVVEHVQLQLSPVGANVIGGRATATKRTPIRFKTPTHPLARSSKATPTRLTEAPAISRNHSESEAAQSIKENLPDCGHTCKSPPISVSKGLGTLPGIHCTDNDLAFLQRMQAIKTYEELKAEAEQLEKTHRTAAEQREQFQHEVLKIEHDLQDMKLNYQEAASSVQSLISKLKDCSLNQHEMSPKPAIKANPRETEEMVLTQEKLTQLRKLNQLSMAKVEKTEKEVKGKLAEVEKEKHQLQTKIREEEERKFEERARLQSESEATKKDEQKWKQRVDQEEQNYTSLKNRLKEAQSELEALQQENHEEKADASISDKDQSFVMANEKRRTEERLRRIIRRCELYIQRHKMLREMGTK